MRSKRAIRGVRRLLPHVLREAILAASHHNTVLKTAEHRHIRCCQKARRNHECSL